MTTCRFRLLVTTGIYGPGRRGRYRAPPTRPTYARLGGLSIGLIRLRNDYAHKVLEHLSAAAKSSSAGIALWRLPGGAEYRVGNAEGPAPSVRRSSHAPMR